MKHWSKWCQVHLEAAYWQNISLELRAGASITLLLAETTWKKDATARLEISYTFRTKRSPPSREQPSSPNLGEFYCLVLFFKHNMAVKKFAKLILTETHVRLSILTHCVRNTKAAAGDKIQARELETAVRRRGRLEKERLVSSEIQIQIQLGLE